MFNRFCRGQMVNGQDMPLAKVLRFIRVPLIAQPICQKIYKNDFNKNFMICAGVLKGGVDACIGNWTFC